MPLCVRERQGNRERQKHRHRSPLPGSTHGEDTAVWLGGTAEGPPSRDPPSAAPICYDSLPLNMVETVTTCHQGSGTSVP